MVFPDRTSYSTPRFEALLICPQSILCLPTRFLKKFIEKIFYFYRFYILFLYWKKVKVTQSCLTLCNPVDYTVHGIPQARILEWVAFPFSRGLPNPGIKPRFPALQVDSLPSEPQGKSKNTGVGSLPLLQGIFLTRNLLFISYFIYSVCFWLLRSVWDLSSQTRDQTWAPWSGGTEP